MELQWSAFIGFLRAQSFHPGRKISKPLFLRVERKEFERKVRGNKREEEREERVYGHASGRNQEVGDENRREKKGKKRLESTRT